MAEQFSFDVVSEVDMQEMKNVVDQATKEVKLLPQLMTALRSTAEDVRVAAFELVANAGNDVV